MSLLQKIESYSKQTAEEEQRFKDLFGRQEFEEMRKSYFAIYKNINKTYLEYMRDEKLRKLREQDGDSEEL